MQKINVVQSLVLCVLIFAYSTSNAETFNYSFISVSYEKFSEDIDGIPEDLEGDGVYVDIAYNIVENVAIIASYGTGSADVTSGGTTLDADVDIIALGAIYHKPTNETTDFLIGFQLIQGTIDIDINGSFYESEDSDGNSILIGIRTMADKNIEFRAIIDRSDIEGETDSDINLRVSYYMDRLLTIDAGYSFDNDGDALSLGVTKYF